jgi:glycosyltransferase involved in cell wall biosynthesis
MAKKAASLKILFLGEPDSPNTKSWIEGLRRQGCEVFLASARSEGNRDCFPIGNIKLPPRLRILTGVKSVRSLIKKLQPDILLAYRITSYGYLAAKTGFHPLVIAAQNEQIVYLPNPTFLRQKFLTYCAKYAIKRADLIHSWGGNITGGLKKFGAVEEKILTLHRGIDTSRFSKSENSRPFNEKTPVFISTRTLAPEYLIDRLLKAFAELVKKIPGARLEIAGSGSEEQFLKQLTVKLKIEDSVMFHGRMESDELLNLIRNSDFYISVIETEGISSSLIEAVVCGIIPIAIDMQASRQLIDNDTNGILIPSAEVGEIAEAMLSAVKQYQLLKEGSEKNAVKKNDKYDRTTNQKIFIDNYLQLLAEK